jgi:hypothetical protein
MRYVIPIDAFFAKAKDYSNLVLKEVKPGVRRWVDPSEDEDPKLFGDDAGGEDKHGGYHDKLRQDTFTFQVKPLLQASEGVDKALSARLAQKYKDYIFDQDTLELDLKMDYDSLYYMGKFKATKDPKERESYRSEYYEKTDKVAQQINNRKRAMLKAKKGMEIETPNGKGKIKGFTKRGFPIVDIGGKTSKWFWDELKVKGK